LWPGLAERRRRQTILAAATVVCVPVVERDDEPNLV
jgi:hypothetical protein